MNAKSLIIGTVAAALVMWLLGWLWYGILMMDFFEAHSGSATGVSKGPEEMDMGYLILGELIIGFILAYNWPKWSRGTNNFGHGFEYGAWIGALIGVGLGFIWYATSNLMDMTGMLVDAIYSIVSVGLAGGVIAFIYKITS